jgi:DNA-binding PadR family transcriptional regulator
MEFSKELVAASATPIILAVLRIGDSYGYEIICTVRSVSADRISWTDGMLYPVLHRMEDSRLIESYWFKADNGRRRKYYHITPEGVDHYEQIIGQWEVIRTSLQRLESEQRELSDV